MKRLLTALAALLLLIVTAAPASAEVERIPIEVETEVVGIVDFGSYSETGQVIHVVDIVWLFNGTGHDLFEGELYTTLSFTANRVTGKGAGHGTFVALSSNYPDSGWEGTLLTKYENFDFNTGFGDLTTDSVSHGFGAFEGMQMRLESGAEGGLVGEILIPPSAPGV